MMAVANPAPPRYQYTRPWLYPKQEEALFNDKRIAVIEASTKSGKTVAALAWLFEVAYMTGKEGRNFWWLAPVFRQARIAYERLKTWTRDVPGLATWNDSGLMITLANGARISFISAERPDHLYGDDVMAAVLDEATRMREESWTAIRTTLTATRGPVRIIGNVKGRKNWVYRLARRAEAGERNMHYSRMTAYDASDAGVLSEQEVEDAKADMPESAWRELYLALPSEDSGNPFGEQYINACLIDSTEAWGNWDGDDQPVTWGWDLAKSVDWTVGIGLASDGSVCRLRRFQQPWMETMRIVRDETKDVPALVDSTGVGDAVVEQLQRPFDTGRGERYDGHNFQGQKFTQHSKQQMMEMLAIAIQHGDISFPNGVIPSELLQFEYVYTRTGARYDAPQGAHDDCVDALALAVTGWRHPPQRWGAI